LPECVNDAKILAMELLKTNLDNPQRRRCAYRILTCLELAQHNLLRLEVADGTNEDLSDK